MELKRYVLLEKKQILDLLIIENDFITGLTNYIVNGSKTMLFKLNKIAKEGYINVDEEVIKTSDNILDLVEVGDILKLIYDDKTVKLIYMIADGYSFDVKDFNSRIEYVHLLKLQPNGDYKKYEVLAWVYM